LVEVVTAVAQRLRREAGPELRTTLWAATQLLMGLHHPKEYVYGLTKEITTMILGIRGIEESSVYQDIYAKGAMEEDRKILLSLGRDKLGPPDERVEAQVAAMTNQERLHYLLHRVLHVSTWDELLASEES
jgi:hypothetical protein